MKKNARTLIFLGVVLVLFIGAYVGVSLYNKGEDQKKTAETQAAQLWSGGKGEPVTFSYTTGSATLSFVKNSGSWTVSDNKDFPLNQSTVSGLVSSLTGLSAVRTLDLPKELSLYGLDKPTYTLWAADDKGNGLTLLIGAATGDNFYAMAKDGAKVYTIPGTLVSSLKPSYLSMVTIDSIPNTTSTSIEAITATGGNKTLKLDRHQNKDNSYTWFVITGDTYTSADEVTLAAPSEKSATKLISDAVAGLSYMTFSSCAAYKPTGEELKKFGLDTPAIKVAVAYEDTTGAGTTDQKTTKGTVNLEIGAALQDGSGYYARLAGSNEVCVLPSTAVTPLNDALNAIGTAG